MRRAIYTLLLLAASASAAPQSVTVCTSTTVQGPTITEAQRDTTALFAGIGVQLSWPALNAPCPQGGLQIAIKENTPRSLRPNALAYSRPLADSTPLEGIHIEVFYDRIFANHRNTRRQVLAYVLAHELGHVLQGLPRHSELGIMKPFWNHDDYRLMLGARLKFAPEDVALIKTNPRNAGSADQCGYGLPSPCRVPPFGTPDTGSD